MLKKKPMKKKPSNEPSLKNPDTLNPCIDSTISGVSDSSAETNGGTDSSNGSIPSDVFITDYDIHLFREGNHFHLYKKLGSHLVVEHGVAGVRFAVWAPNAKGVSVIGSFNGWDPVANGIQARWDHSGIWEGFIAGVKKGDTYKYHIESHQRGYKVDKGDPYAYFWEPEPHTASIVWDLEYAWRDAGWMSGRRGNNRLDKPISIYEVHLGSWRRVVEDNHRSLSYREMADQLVGYVKEMGFTHVEFLPVMEHPFYGSWGYQIVGFFAPTSRYGTPQDFMYLVDTLHQNGIGVFLDWVPSHFPSNENGLVFFDGTHLYEHEDMRKGFHPDWKSYIFNYGRNEVKNFLISNAVYWLDKYHIDGLRVDGVASMLYLDYSRNEGEWIPNRYGGRENIEAIDFLRRFNEVVYTEFPDVQTIAEESTAWPMVSRPAYAGGLGFGMKWNMGWMHDMLKYMSHDPIYRKHHQNQLTFCLLYAFNENFILPLSHDEVVHGKGSLLGKMPGDEWQKFANLRLLAGYQYMQPGKKLLFMGCELAQWHEWNHDASLQWDLVNYDRHRDIRRWYADLNHFYRNQPALYEKDFTHDGFQWIDFSDIDNSVIAFIRRSSNPGDMLVIVCNFTPVLRLNYRIGVPDSGYWREMLNSDAKEYGGSGHGNLGGVESAQIRCHGMDHSVTITVPPLGMIVFKRC